MQAPETEETIDLREYIAILRARKWMIILTVALVVIAALAFSLQQTPLYTAEARLLVEPVPTQEAESLPPVVNLETERELVRWPRSSRRNWASTPPSTRCSGTSTSRS